MNIGIENFICPSIHPLIQPSVCLSSIHPEVARSVYVPLRSPLREADPYQNSLPFQSETCKHRAKYGVKSSEAVIEAAG